MVPDEEIRKHVWSGLLEIFLKHTRQRDLLELMNEALKQFIIPLLAKNGAKAYLSNMIYYGISQGNVKDKKAFLEWLHKELPEELGKKTMRSASW